MTLSVAAGFLRTRRERLYGRVLRVFDAWEPKACLWRLSFCRLLPSSHTAGLLPAVLVGAGERAQQVPERRFGLGVTIA